MLTLDDISKICSGLAWGRNVNPMVDDFKVNVSLPFPFYDALQREMGELMASMPTQSRKLRPDEAPQFVELHFPNGITANVTPHDKSIVFEPVIGAKVVQMDTGRGGYLKPGGQRA